MSAAVLQLSGVFCVHRSGEGDAAALQGLDLEVARGEVLTVLGPSGAGKSTLLRVIAGLQTPTAGVVSLLGRDIGRVAAGERARLRRRELGFFGQRIAAAGGEAMTIRSAVSLPLALRGVGGRARAARADELLSAVGLGDRATARLSQLSGGERQRVALCAAVAHRPALLLADEPSGELDADNAAIVRDLITSLCRTGGSSAIVASHDPAMASAADRVVVVRDGRVVETGRGGMRAAVVGRGGWLPVGEELLARAGISASARIRVTDAGVLISPDSSAVPAAISPAVDSLPGSVPVLRGAAVAASAVVLSRGRGRSRRRVLDGLSISFAPGALTAVTGRSGSGKTTLLRLLAGLEAPEAGEITIDGAGLRGLDAEQLAALRRDRIAYLSQEPTPVPFLSAIENIVLALELRGVSRPQARERAVRGLAGLGLSERATQPAARLSAGELQRLALARSLACSSGLLLLDEPTSRLDRAAAQAVAHTLDQAARTRGHTIICATHDPELVTLAGAVVEL